MTGAFAGPRLRRRTRACDLLGLAPGSDLFDRLRVLERETLRLAGEKATDAG